MPRNLAYALAAAGAVAALLLTAIVGAQPGQLHVEQVRFLRGEGEGRNTTLDAVLYLTSDGGTSRDVRIVTYLYARATGIAEDRQVVDVGPVAGGRTEEVRVVLRVPWFDPARTPSWNADFLVFEDERLTLEGHGTVGFRQVSDIAGGAPTTALDASAGPFERVG
ncbi:MAG TPA: hypothetical protein VGR28_04460 [Candidatus Thermoplasmatota archaeon]|jgi:hypothetical protein|nr:hypothetical protein [Candidatus Thermoplasmatota archaeon]